MPFPSKCHAPGVIRAGGAPVWTPASFPSVTGWWEARDLSGTADGVSVTSLPGKVASRDFAQSGASAVPTKQTRSTHHCLQFLSASNQMLRLTQTLSTMIGSTGLMALVLELNGNPSLTSTTYYLDNYALADQGSYFAFHVATISSQPGAYAAIWDGAAKARFIPFPVSQRHLVMMWRTSGSVLQCSLDGVAQADVTAVGAPQNQTFQYTIAFQDAGDGGNRAGNIWFYAAVMSTANGTAGDRTSLVDYLKTLYGIA